VLKVELHRALFGKDKIKPNKWEQEFLRNLWASYLNVGKFDKLTNKQRELLKKIIKKYRSKKKKLLLSNERSEAQK
jgi:TRAP-type C4-dicarboxylate transport system substrate-binding protein